MRNHDPLAWYPSGKKGKKILWKKQQAAPDPESKLTET
jgi:hypothetical protein